MQALLVDVTQFNTHTAWYDARNKEGIGRERQVAHTCKCGKEPTGSVEMWGIS